jgi:threonine synthase
MSIWRFADSLPAVPAEHRVSLGEGNTPLVRSRAIGPREGLKNLYFKLDMLNPTGSYKDRFAAAAISVLRAAGVRRCLATTSGNTGAALAAYSAAAGIACEIAIVETAPLAKLKQMLAYGASLYRIQGFGLDPDVTRGVLAHLQERSQGGEASLQISAYRFSPEGMAGVQTISYELAEQMNGVIGHVFCPAGGGGLALAVARGFAELRRGTSVTGLNLPRVEVVQPAGNDTIASPLREGADRAREVRCHSQISGLQVPNVIDGDDTLAECRATRGTGHVVEDEGVWEMQRRLAHEAGSFVEPAGAVALTGAIEAARKGEVSPEAPVVCLLTGFGFKDTASIDRLVGEAVLPLIDLPQFVQKL